MTTLNSEASSGVIAKDGRRLTTLEEWHRYAPPKGRTHWKDGRSAKENARLWLGAAPGLPPGIPEVLRSCGSNGVVRSWSAKPEARVKFDAVRGEPANIDVLVKAEDEYGPIVIGIEAKADETFGSTVGNTLSRAQQRLARDPRSKGVERIRQLLTTFGLDVQRSEVVDLRYQLLTVTAATLAEAHRQSAQRAFVIVHEFITPLTTAKKRASNTHDLCCFLRTVLGHTSPIPPGISAGPFRNGRIDRLYFGKTETRVEGDAMLKEC